jgi:hypothetical protein
MCVKDLHEGCLEKFEESKVLDIFGQVMVGIQADRCAVLIVITRHSESIESPQDPTRAHRAWEPASSKSPCLSGSKQTSAPFYFEVFQKKKLVYSVAFARSHWN